MNLVLVAVACTALALLGIRSLVAGQASVGIASLMLACANWLLLSRSP